MNKLFLVDVELPNLGREFSLEKRAFLLLVVLGLLTVLGLNLFANLDGETVVVVVLVVVLCLIGSLNLVLVRGLEGGVVCSNLDDARERDLLLLEV